MRGGRVMGQDTFPVGSGSRANVVCTLIAVGYVSVVLRYSEKWGDTLSLQARAFSALWQKFGRDRREIASRRGC